MPTECPECGDPYDPGESGCIAEDMVEAFGGSHDATHWERVCLSMEPLNADGHAMYVHTATDIGADPADVHERAAEKVAEAIDAAENRCGTTIGRDASTVERDDV